MHGKAGEVLLFSIICLMVKTSVDIVCLDQIYKGRRICFVHLFHKKLCFISGYYGIEQAGPLTGIAAIPLKTGGRMVGQLGNLVVNQIRMSGNDE